MAIKTSADMVTLILRKQYVLEGGEVPSAEDKAVTLEAFLSHLDWLRDEGIVWWNDDETPLNAADALADYMALYCPVLPQNERDAFLRSSAMGLDRLRKLAAKSSQGAPIRADYF